MYRRVKLIKKSIYGRPGDIVTFSTQVAHRYCRDGLGEDVGPYEVEKPLRIERVDGTIEESEEMKALQSKPDGTEPHTDEAKPEDEAKSGAGPDAELKNKGARKTVHK